MNVNLDLQTICNARNLIRGIPYYTIEVTRQLLLRDRNNYTASFFDFQKERNNRAFLDLYLSDVIDRFAGIFECNNLSYKTILDALITDDPSTYNQYSYKDYIGVNADVYHIFHLLYLPQNMDGLRTVVTVHDIMPFLEKTRACFSPASHEQFTHALGYLRKSKQIRVIADSESTKSDLVQVAGIEEERIRVIYPAYNGTLFYPDTNTDAMKKFKIPKEYILYLGALDPRKGIDTILEAEKYMEDRETAIVLAGNPESNYDIRAVMNKTNNPERFILTGYVTDEEKRQLLSNAVVFLFPSLYEGFGLPVLEAMACGTPVITTNVSSLPEVGGDAAVYIEPGNAEQLAHEMETLLSNQTRRDFLREKGFAHAKVFSWEHTAELIEKAYDLCF